MPPTTHASRTTADVTNLSRGPNHPYVTHLLKWLKVTIVHVNTVSCHGGYMWLETAADFQ